MLYILAYIYKKDIKGYTLFWIITTIITYLEFFKKDIAFFLFKQEEKIRHIFMFVSNSQKMYYEGIPPLFFLQIRSVGHRELEWCVVENSSKSNFLSHLEMIKLIQIT